LERGDCQGEEAHHRAIWSMNSRCSLENIDKFALQTHLNKLAKTRSRTECCRFGPICEQSLARRRSGFPRKRPRAFGEDSGAPSGDRQDTLSGSVEGCLVELASGIGFCSNSICPMLCPGVVRLRWKCFDPQFRRSQS